ncbi:MAG: hypothetical protein CPSOU_6283 [uncultured Paraburkholderia sp.]|nr:MAG: hypothetical protein CPSOU_6283 [uncultured Paraburkholderia sp.]
MAAIPGANPADCHLSASQRLSSCPQRRIGIVLPDAGDLPGAQVVAEAFNLASRIARTDRGIGTYQVVFLSRHGGAILTASSIEPCTDAVVLPKSWTFGTLFVAASRQPTHPTRSDRLAPWLDRICGEATDIIHFDQNSPTLEVARPIRAKRPSSPASQTPDDALSAALRVIRRDCGDALAWRVSRELSIVLQPPVSTALDGTEPQLLERVRRAARWLENNCGLPVTAGDAAAVVAMNVSTFVRHFQRELGVSPSGYLLDLRLQIALQLLVGTDLPIGKVARRAGMRSRAHLARQFQLHFKILPMEYRAFHRDEGAQHEGTTSAATKAAAGNAQQAPTGP